MRFTPVSAVLALSLALASCGSDPVESGGPTGAECPGAPVPLCTDVGYATAVLAALGDAAGRIAPAMSTGPRTAVLPGLEALESALDAGDVSGALELALELRATLAAERATATEDDLPSLDAITLAVMQAELALGSTPAALTRATP